MHMLMSVNEIRRSAHHFLEAFELCIDLATDGADRQSSEECHTPQPARAWKLIAFNKLGSIHARRFISQDKVQPDFNITREILEQCRIGRPAA